MQPDAVVRAELSDGLQRIDSTANSGAGRCHDGKTWESTGFHRLECIFKSSGTERSIRVNRQLLQCICGQPHHHGCFLQRDVGIPTAENHALVRSRS